MAAVARRLGVAPATLRTWDRRYGLGPSGHTNGKHRRYSPLDIARLEVMQRALLSGASTAEAARYALDTVRPEEDAEPDTAVSVPSQQAATQAPRLELADRGGARVSGLARKLSAASLAMDARSVRQVMTDAIAAEGAVTAWEDVIKPVLDAVGTGWRDTRPGPEVKHLLAELALATLVRAAPQATWPRSHHPVLLACQPTQRNTLGLYAFSAGLAERGIDAVVIGSALPPEVLLSMVRGTAPAAVVLMAQDAASPTLFTRLARGRLRSRLFACGPGWDPAGLPGTVEQLGDLRSAVGRVSYVLLGR